MTWGNGEVEHQWEVARMYVCVCVCGYVSLQQEHNIWNQWAVWWLLLRSPWWEVNSPLSLFSALRSPLLTTAHLPTPTMPARLALMQPHDRVLLAADRWAFIWNHSLRQERARERPCCVEVVPQWGGRGWGRKEEDGVWLCSSHLFLLEDSKAQDQ